MALPRLGAARRRFPRRTLARLRACCERESAAWVAANEGAPPVGNRQNALTLASVRPRGAPTKSPQIASSSFLLSSRLGHGARHREGSQWRSPAIAPLAFFRPAAAPFEPRAARERRRSDNIPRNARKADRPRRSQGPRPRRIALNIASVRVEPLPWMVMGENRRRTHT